MAIRMVKNVNKDKVSVKVIVNVATTVSLEGIENTAGNLADVIRHRLLKTAQIIPDCEQVSINDAGKMVTSETDSQFELPGITAEEKEEKEAKDGKGADKGK